MPPYFQLSNLEVQIDETLTFARYRASWRSWNLKILLSRPVVLQWALRLRHPDSNSSSDSIDELECRKICTRSASATISSISDFMATGIVSRLSTWYMLLVVPTLR